MGTNPKTYMRIIRFATAYDYVQSEPAILGWAQLFCQFGYADQAHFIRDFKQFTGKAPTQFITAPESFYQRSCAVI